MGVFTAAMASVFGNIGAALRVLLLPMAVMMTVNLWSFDPGFDAAVVPALIALVVDLTFACLVAVGWHRFALLSETPGEFAPRWHGQALREYFLTWFALGLLLMFVTLASVLVLYWIGMAVLPFHESLDSIALLAGAEPVGFNLIYIWFGTWLFLYLLFRLGLSLPARASFGMGVQLRKAWGLTRALRGELLAASFLASIFVTALFYGPMMIYELNSSESEIGYIIYSLSADFGYALNVLFGAAILNEIFRRAVPQDELEAELEKAG